MTLLYTSVLGKSPYSDQKRFSKEMTRCREEKTDSTAGRVDEIPRTKTLEFEDGLCYYNCSKNDSIL